MKVDPYAEHPDSPPKSGEESEKKLLTKKEVFAIIDEEIKKTESRAPSIWGLTRDDIIEAIEKVREKIEEI